MTNEERIRKKVEKYIATIVHRDVLRKLDILSDRITLFLESGVIPVRTGNLQDSTGVGIYHGDCLMRYIPRQTATEARANGENRPLYLPDLPNKNVWGHDELQKALDYGAMKFSNDYWLVVFSAMPYANSPEGRMDFFITEIEPEIKSLAMSIFKSFVRL